MTRWTTGQRMHTRGMVLRCWIYLMHRIYSIVQNTRNTVRKKRVANVHEPSGVIIYTTVPRSKAGERAEESLWIGIFSNLACDGLVGSVARSPPVTTRGSCASDQDTKCRENSKHPGESAKDICDTCSKSGQRGSINVLHTYLV